MYKIDIVIITLNYFYFDKTHTLLPSELLVRQKQKLLTRKLLMF